MGNSCGCIGTDAKQSIIEYADSFFLYFLIKLLFRFVIILNLVIRCEGKFHLHQMETY